MVALGAVVLVVVVGKTLTGLSPLLEPNTQITAFGSHLPAETSHKPQLLEEEIRVPAWWQFCFSRQLG